MRAAEHATIPRPDGGADEVSPAGWVKLACMFAILICTICCAILAWWWYPSGYALVWIAVGLAVAASAGVCWKSLVKKLATTPLRDRDMLKNIAVSALIVVVVIGFIGTGVFQVICTTPSDAPRCVPAVASQEYYVIQRLASGSTTGSTFPVAVPDAHSDIAHLKKAIKAEVGTDYTRNPALLTIYTPDGSKATAPDAPLQSNTAKAPYQFELPHI